MYSETKTIDQLGKTHNNRQKMANTLIKGNIMFTKHHNILTHMRILIFVFFTICSSNSFAQEFSFIVDVSCEKDMANNSFNSTAMISSNGEMPYEYPQEAKDKSVSGSVYVSYELDSLYQIRNIKIHKGLGYGLDEIALKMMPFLQKGYDSVENKGCILRGVQITPFSFVIK